VQPKLTVGPAGDLYEQEADRIAAEITRSPAPSSPGGQVTHANHVQRMTPVPSSSQSAPIGLQGGMVGSNLEGTLRRAKSGGTSLPKSVRKTLEPKLGVDLSPVKVHTGSRAAQLSREMGAKAFTHQNHIFYGEGQSPSDLRLTAHEAVHTVQQGAVQRAPLVDAPSPAADVHYTQQPKSSEIPKMTT
jgi:hypothetical protein